MKKTNFRAGLVVGGAMLGLMAGCTTYIEAPRPAPVVVEPPPPVVVSQPLPPTEVVVIHEERDFYEPLNAYGRWVDVPGYGRCWTPGQVDPDWRPYSLGHWQRTDAGWYWVSDEPWGWATYHYGRWFLDAQAGWVWVPRTQWAPAWVSFHQGGGYTGWAPLPPSARVRGDGIVEVDVRTRKPREFVFVEDRKFLQPVRPTTVVVNNTTIINQTVNITNVKIVNNTVINEGPRREIVEKSSGQAVSVIAVNDLRRKQEAPVVAKRIAVQTPDVRAREEAARREELAKAQIEAQKKSQEEARLKAQQAAERDRLAQIEVQRKAKEAEMKAAQERAARERAAMEAEARRANEIKARAEAEKQAQEQAKLKAAQAQADERARVAQVEAQRKAREAEMKAKLEAEKQAQLEAQRKAKEAEMKAAQEAAARRANEVKPAAPVTGPKPVAGRVDDTVLQSKAKGALAAVPELRGVTIATTNGVIHLSGTVASAEQKKQAALLTRRIEGIRDVQNNITVKP